ncbi:antirestriction protein ArdA [Streptomyces sp. NPDC002698]|uniref:antirestriction protein ArdA n=1 Tax=Streptomyces sp. NPDC002698 TaxID=3364660 RepID=UPI003693E40E
MPSIYVASLADYVAGTLHGEWIDADQDADAIHEEVAAMLEKSPLFLKYGDAAEEWAIHDYEGFGGVSLSEYESIERVAEIAGLLREHPSAVVAYFLGTGHEPDKIPDLIDDALLHTSDEWSEVRAVSEWHYERLEERKDIPQDIKDSHLGAIAEDMAHSDINGGAVHTIQVRSDSGSTIYVLSSDY